MTAALPLVVNAWPPFVYQRGRRVWVAQSSRYCIDEFDASEGLTLMALRRGAFPIRIHYTVSEALALIERGDLREY